ncbi:hypothetical protein [Cellulosimicrobium sp. 22601]|uniref:hypothetical protein n=1 Tax=unclassified Cellulosimicrobium TaxID=2624466 RepID=UPI003F86C7DD
MSYVAPSLNKLRDQINAAWPGRDRSSDGAIGDAAHASRPSDHNPAPPTGVIRARDFDVDGIPVHSLVAALTLDPRTAYLIYDEQIWTPGSGWRPYNGVNPHTGHFHISVRHGALYENDTSAWALKIGDVMDADLGARLDQIVAWMDARFDALDAKLGAVDARLKNVPADTWKYKLGHTITKKPVAAGDLLRYEPAEHRNTREAITGTKEPL